MDAANQTSYCNAANMPMAMGMMGWEGNGDTCLIWLFQNAVLISKEKYQLAVLGSFFLGFLVEIIRFVRNKVAAASKKKDRASVNLTSSCVALMDISATLLFALQMVVAYCVMLIVMLYDVLIFSAVILGLAIGHFIILRSQRADRLRRRTLASLVSITDSETVSLLNSTNSAVHHADGDAILRKGLAESTPAAALDSDDEADVVASPCCANDA